MVLQKVVWWQLTYKIDIWAINHSNDGSILKYLLDQKEKNPLIINRSIFMLNPKTNCLTLFFSEIGGSHL